MIRVKLRADDDTGGERREEKKMEKNKYLYRPCCIAKHHATKMLGP